MNEINQNINYQEETVKTTHNEGQYASQEIIDYYLYTKKTLIIGLVCILTFFLIIPLFVFLVFQIIWLVKTFTLKTNDRDLKNEALLWGILSFLLLGIFGNLIFYLRIQGRFPELKMMKKTK
ncbi:MAG: hypothetical protein ACRCVI_02455 [Mycoplasmoidaceae bacterium]